MAFQLLADRGILKHDVVPKDAAGPVRSDLSHVQFGIEIGPCGAEQAVLQGDELAFGRVIGLRDPLDVETPTFDVDGIDREDGAGDETEVRHNRCRGLVKRLDRKSVV